jgi:hypothetical protein
MPAGPGPAASGAAATVLVVGPGLRFWVRAGWGVARRPWLWPTAIMQAGRLATPGWWRHPPYLPWPDPAYLRFRLETQYGSAAGTDRMEPRDLVVYLEWCRAMALTRPRHRDGRG